jgi:hypothetical protein
MDKKSETEQGKAEQIRQTADGFVLPDKPAKAQGQLFGQLWLQTSPDVQ